MCKSRKRSVVAVVVTIESTDAIIDAKCQDYSPPRSMSRLNVTVNNAKTESNVQGLRGVNIGEISIRYDVSHF
jgi:hypothetical protein